MHEANQLQCISGQLLPHLYAQLAPQRCPQLAHTPFWKTRLQRVMQTHNTSQGWSWSHQFGLLVARFNIYIKSVNIYIILAVSSSLTCKIICFWILDSRKAIASNYKSLDPVDDDPFELAQLLLFVSLQRHEVTAKAALLFRKCFSPRLRTIFSQPM